MNIDKTSDPIDFASLPTTSPLDSDEESALLGRLREEGLVVPGGLTLQSHPTSTWGAGWKAAAAIAAITLFTSGLLLGERRGAERTLATFEVAAEASATQHAAQVQRLGSLYVESLASLGSLETGSEAASRDQGVQSAKSILWASVAELARLNPDDADLQRILTLLSGPAAEGGSQRTLYWF